MTLRKGQHLFNEIAKQNILREHKCTDWTYPYYNLHQILFYMTDADFDKIMALHNSKEVRK